MNNYLAALAIYGALLTLAGLLMVISEGRAKRRRNTARAASMMAETMMIWGGKLPAIHGPEPAKSEHEIA